MDSSNKGESEKTAERIIIFGAPLVFGIGVIGNILTILVMGKTRRSSTSVYLMFLAMSDIAAVAVLVPRWWLVYVNDLDVRHLSNYTCKVHMFFTYLFPESSNLVLVAVTIERIMATRRPFSVQRMCTIGSATSISVSLFVFAFLFNSHILYGFELFARENHHTRNDTLLPRIDLSNINETSSVGSVENGRVSLEIFTTDKYTFGKLTTLQPYFKTTESPFDTITQSDDRTGTTAKASGAHFVCNVRPNSPYEHFYNDVYQWADLTISAAIPTVIFLIGTIVILNKLLITRSQTLKKAGDDTMAPVVHVVKDVQALRVSMMLVSVNIVFIVCNTPFYVLLLSRDQWVDPVNGMTDDQEIMWIVFQLLFSLNYAVNFILYVMSGQKFRSRVVSLLTCDNNDLGSTGSSYSISRRSMNRSVL